MQGVHSEMSVIQTGLPFWLRFRFIHGHAVENFLVQRHLDVLVSANRGDDSCIEVLQIGRKLDHYLHITVLDTIPDIFHVWQMRSANGIFQ